MADTKISAQTAAAAALATHEFPVNEGGVPKKVTLAQAKTLMNTAPVIAAGTASAATWPVYTSGTLLTSPVAGALEYDATNFYLTMENSNRGVVAVEWFIRANATRTFTSNTAQQAIFTTPTNGAITLPVGVYEFEAFFGMDTMSATSGNGIWSLLGAGTATLTQVLQLVHGVDAQFDANNNITGHGSALTTDTTSNSLSANVSTEVMMFVKGTFNVSVTGTIIPSYAQTTAAAAVLKIGSFIKIKRIGAQGMTSVGNWS